MKIFPGRGLTGDVTAGYTLRMVDALFEITSICKGGGYRYCRTIPPHPRRNAKGLYPLHIVRMENKLGRLLQPGETVHHIDENKKNDRPSNLEVLFRPAHAKLHAEGRAPLPVQTKCDECSKPLTVKPHEHRNRVGRNRMGRFFCSKSCGSTFWARQR